MSQLHFIVFLLPGRLWRLILRGKKNEIESINKLIYFVPSVRNSTTHLTLIFRVICSSFHSTNNLFYFLISVDYNYSVKFGRLFLLLVGFDLSTLHSLQVSNNLLLHFLLSRKQEIRFSCFP